MKNNNWNYYSPVESLFIHDLNHAQILVLGIIENTTEEFRIVTIKNRNSNILSKFITKFIPKGNYFISSGGKVING